MTYHPKEYDIIVIGAGHAGCEAALAAARMGCTVLLMAIDLQCPAVRQLAAWLRGSS